MRLPGGQRPSQCPASAPMRQIGRVEEGRISGLIVAFQGAKMGQKSGPAKEPPLRSSSPQGDRSRRKTSVLRPMISARTARIDDNLGRGTDGSNPLPSTGESASLEKRCSL